MGGEWAAGVGWGILSIHGKCVEPIFYLSFPTRGAEVSLLVAPQSGLSYGVPRTLSHPSTIQVLDTVKSVAKREREAPVHQAVTRQQQNFRTCILSTVRICVVSQPKHITAHLPRRE